MNLEVIVRLRDQFSKGLDGVKAKLGVLGSAAQAAGRQIQDLGAQMAALGVGTAFGVAASVKQFATMDTILRDIGITAGKSGPALEKFIKGYKSDLQKLAFEIGQTSRELALGAQLLIKRGMGEDLVREMLPAVGRVATAIGGKMDEVADTAFQLSTTMKVAAGDMEKAFAIIATQGKLGSFEARDFARFGPTIFSKMGMLQSMGLRGVAIAGAMTQTAMRGAADPGVAANNVANFLQKINQKDTAKNFAKEFGIDIQAVQTDAIARGLDPIEAVMQKIVVATQMPMKEIEAVIARAKAAGLDATKTEDELKKAIGTAGGTARLQKIFGDVQVLDFLSAFLLNRDFYRQVRDAGMTADTSGIGTDFASRMAGPEKRLEMAGERFSQITDRVGEALQGLIAKLEYLGAQVQRMIGWLDTNAPGLADRLIQLGTAAGAAAAALGALSLMRGIGGGGSTSVSSSGATAATAAASRTLPALARFGLPAAGGIVVFKALEEMNPTTPQGFNYRLNLDAVEPGLDAAYNRSYREALEARRDPEAARGRAMGEMQRRLDESRITIRVEGEVRSVTSDNPAIRIETDRGATALRP